MRMSPVTVAVLLASSNTTRVVFAEILKSRSAIFKDLTKVVGGRSDAREAVETAVSQLKDADLIKERTSAIEDFNAYYVTASGLAAERDLNTILRSAL